MSLNQHHHLPQKCPWCLAELDRVSNWFAPGNPAPKPGDLTQCIKCGKISEFGPTLDLVPFDVSRLDSPEARAQIWLQQEAWEQTNREKYSRLSFPWRGAPPKF